MNNPTKKMIMMSGNFKRIIIIKQKYRFLNIFENPMKHNNLIVQVIARIRGRDQNVLSRQFKCKFLQRIVNYQFYFTTFKDIERNTLVVSRGLSYLFNTV